MTVKRFTMKELAGVEWWVNDKIRQGAKRGLLSLANRMVGIIVNDVIPNENPQPVDTRHFAMGWRAEPTEHGARVLNTLPYASIIEYGARAENIKIGRVMIDALTEWVIRKGIAGAPQRSKSGKLQQQVNARNIAWAIAMAMKKRGIFNRDDARGGLRVGEKGLAKVLPFAKQEVAAEINKDR
jgi:hypothetical protein